MIYETTRNITGKSTVTSESDEEYLNIQKQRIEKCRRVFLRRHASLTRIVEKDLQELREAQKRNEEERKRRVSYCALLHDGNSKEVGATNKCDLQFNHLSREDMLLFGLRTRSCYSKNMLPLEIAKMDRGAGRIHRSLGDIAKKDMRLKPVYRITKFSPNIRI